MWSVLLAMRRFAHVCSVFQPSQPFTVVLLDSGLIKNYAIDRYLYGVPFANGIHEFCVSALASYFPASRDSNLQLIARLIFVA